MEGVEIHVVHPNEIKWISQSSGKTDKIDARKLAHLGRGDMLLRKVHIVEGKIRELGEFFGRIRNRRGKKIAIVAVARKLLMIAYGVLDPLRLTGVNA